jgi:hypothetical protein
MELIHDARKTYLVEEDIPSISKLKIMIYQLMENNLAPLRTYKAKPTNMADNPSSAS